MIAGVVVEKRVLLETTTNRTPSSVELEAPMMIGKNGGCAKPFSMQLLEEKRRSGEIELLL